FCGIAHVAPSAPQREPRLTGTNQKPRRTSLSLQRFSIDAKAQHDCIRQFVIKLPLTKFDRLNIRRRHAEHLRKPWLRLLESLAHRPQRMNKLWSPWHDTYSVWLIYPNSTFVIDNAFSSPEFWATMKKNLVTTKQIAKEYGKPVSAVQRW